ncbi:MAG: ATP-binding protein [Longimicrobiales bacterium]
MRSARTEIVERWLDRIAARVSIDPNHIFPSQDLLDHVPLLVDGIADYVESPSEEITADVPIVAKAMELGRMRHDQGFDVHEILKEYEILGGIMFHQVGSIIEEIDEPCSRTELFMCAQRLFRGIVVVQQVTTDHYLRLAAETIREREERLRSFNRVLSHELNNRIGAIMGASDLLAGDAELNDELRTRMTGIVANNIREMRDVVDNLVNLTRLDRDMRRQRHVRLPQAVREVARQLRDAASSRGVVVRIGEDIPSVEVDAAAVELCLGNYVANAIKYADMDKDERWVEISSEVHGSAEGGPCDVVVRVRDNGLGVPPDARDQLFNRYFRAHAETVTGIEGTGLGLSIVRETIESIGGRAWAEFSEDGSVFAFSLPCRRKDEGTR